MDTEVVARRTGDTRPTGALLDLTRTGLPDLLARGRSRGYVLLSELHELSDPVGDGPTWLERVARAVRDSGTEVVDDLEADPTTPAPRAITSTTDGVRQYLNAIGRIPLLTAEEEVDLSKRYRAGLTAATWLAEHDDLTRAARVRLRRLVEDGARAQERLVTANLRLVVSIARRYLGRGLSLLELVQEGNLGLMRGVEKFDHAKGFKFSTYATWWIRQALTRGTANKARTVRLPVHVHELVAKVRRVEFELLQEVGRDPTDDEVAEALGVSVERLRELRLAGREITSLDRTLGEDGETTLGDLVRDDDAEDPEERATHVAAKAELAVALSNLHERERSVLELRYGLADGEPRTLEEIGELYGVTRERIRQIEKKTLAKLRHPSQVRSLSDPGH